MRIFSESLIQSFYGMEAAIEDVRQVLLAKVADQIINPLRTVIEYPEQDASVLYMPSADLASEIMAIKAVTIFPHNPQQGLATTQGVMLVSDAKNGTHLALMNASYLTRLRTGALSALATDHLARSESTVLTVIGTGGMAFEQVLGVLSVRTIKTLYLVNPTLENAKKFKQRLRDFGVDDALNIEIITDRSHAVKAADIICCCTRSQLPVFDGADIQAGTHINGVGSYLPQMREVDYNFIMHTDKIVVDDLHGAIKEAGELIHAASKSNWSYDQIYGELKDVVANNRAGREYPEEITFFKSVGAAYFDLAVAKGVYSRGKALNKGIQVET